MTTIAATSRTTYFLEENATILGIFPVPTEVKNIRMDYIKSPTDLSSADDEPFDGITKFDALHQAIVDGAVWLLLETIDGAESTAQLYQRRYNRWITESRQYSVEQMDRPMQLIGSRF